MALGRMLLLFSFVLLLGCGATSFETETVEPPAPPPPAEKAKMVLEGVAQTGELGSGTEELRTLFEEIKQSDSAKGDALLNDLKSLESMNDPSAVQSKAKDMINKL